MSDDRIDEVQELYDRCNKIAKYANWLFLINIAVSFILILDFKYRDTFVIISLLLTIAYVILANINEMYFSNLAENERRKSLLKESFDVNTTLRETSLFIVNSFIY